MTKAPTTAPGTGLDPGDGVEQTAREALARVPIAQPPGVFGRILAWVGRRMGGQPMDVAFAMSHHRRVLWTIGSFERGVARWHTLDGRLKHLAQLAAAAQVGCSWCVDYGYHLALTSGLDEETLRDIGRWRSSDRLSALDKQVVEYAEAMTVTPPQTTDAMVAALRAELGDAALVELTMMVAVENQRSRFNDALGLVAQGYTAACRVPGR